MQQKATIAVVGLAAQDVCHISCKHHHTSGECGHSGASEPHFRCSPSAVDEHIIEQNVEPVAGYEYVHRHFGVVDGVGKLSEGVDGAYGQQRDEQEHIVGPDYGQQVLGQPYVMQKQVTHGERQAPERHISHICHHATAHHACELSIVVAAVECAHQRGESVGKAHAEHQHKSHNAIYKRCRSEGIGIIVAHHYGVGIACDYHAELPQ